MSGPGASAWIYDRNFSIEADYADTLFTEIDTSGLYDFVNSQIPDIDLADSLFIEIDTTGLTSYVQSQIPIDVDSSYNLSSPNNRIDIEKSTSGLDNLFTIDINLADSLFSEIDTSGLYDWLQENKEVRTADSIRHSQDTIFFFNGMSVDTFARSNLEDSPSLDECVDESEEVLIRQTDGSYAWQPYRNLGKLDDTQVPGNYTVLPSDSYVTVPGGSTVTLPVPCDGCGEVTIIKEPCTEGDLSVVASDGSFIGALETDNGISEEFAGTKTYICTTNGWFVKNEALETVYFSYTIPVVNATSQNIRIDQASGDDYTIDWGDGNTEIVTNDATASHAYSPSFTGDITITSEKVTLLILKAAPL